MRFLKLLLILFGFVASNIVTGQIKQNNYSVAQAAIIIDSLETNINNLDKNTKQDVTLKLALLYQNIDAEQSKKNALEYLKNSDSVSLLTAKYSVYELLANIYEKEKKFDSSYYYLSFQSNIVAAKAKEANEKLVSKYLMPANTTSNKSAVSGFSTIQTIIIIALLTIFLTLVIYYFFIKTKFNKLISKKNIELEEANTKLKKINEDVENKVRESTSESKNKLDNSNAKIIELRKKLKKAEESVYLKNNFLGGMSHQIRTPLSGIMGFSDMLETELAVMGNEDLFEYAKNIHESGKKLMSLVSNIFDISNIEANVLELDITNVDINNIINSIEKENLIRAQKKGLTYKTKFDKSVNNVFADKINLKKVLNIIIDNAFTYTSKGFVTISTKQNENRTATITISDKGKGIDTETLKALYDSFDYKKHGSLLTYKNNGLGLILANRLVDLMGGKLELSSEVGIGTQVKIILPCTEGQISDTQNNTQPTKSSIVSAPELGRVKIFIVEDDRMNRLVLEKMLKKSGEIVTAIDGDDTLAILKKNTKAGKIFDIMLFDINLPPPWDGIQLMHEVKKKFPEYKNIPFIAQTAYAMAEDKGTYLDAGFNDYIAKPINKNELLTMIQKQLELFKE